MNFGMIWRAGINAWCMPQGTEQAHACSPNHDPSQRRWCWPSVVSYDLDRCAPNLSPVLVVTLLALVGDGVAKRGEAQSRAEEAVSSSEGEQAG